MKTIIQFAKDYFLLAFILLSTLFLVLSVLMQRIEVLAKFVPVQLLPIAFILMLITLIIASLQK